MNEYMEHWLSDCSERERQLRPWLAYPDSHATLIQLCQHHMQATKQAALALTQFRERLLLVALQHVESVLLRLVHVTSTLATLADSSPTLALLQLPQGEEVVVKRSLKHSMKQQVRRQYGVQPDNSGNGGPSTPPQTDQKDGNNTSNGGEYRRWPGVSLQGFELPAVPPLPALPVPLPHLLLPVLPPSAYIIPTPPPMPPNASPNNMPPQTTPLMEEKSEKKSGKVEEKKEKEKKEGGSRPASAISASLTPNHHKKEDEPVLEGVGVEGGAGVLEGEPSGEVVPLIAIEPPHNAALSSALTWLPFASGGEAGGSTLGAIICGKSTANRNSLKARQLCVKLYQEHFGRQVQACLRETSARLQSLVQSHLQFNKVLSDLLTP
eukprot:TRINITY_DN9071_c0_g2_i2.p1 TRINITY_DN9071_c0_g2~~TRINITY_DN9071_c0_g2_i2.p1  ORF type:complete len:380 (+),score=119.89 TRINITY_DN9071_c0_g2_i2:54-1193(+)